MLVASNNIGARAADSRRVSRHPREKVEIVEHVIAWMAETGLSLSHAAEIIHVSKANLSRWMKDLPALKEKSKSPSGPRTSHAGRTSQLAPVHEELLHFVEEYRFMGFAISKKMLIFQASRLSEEESLFRRNTYGGRLHAVSRWMERNDLVLRKGTHQAQEPPELTMSAAVDFIFHMARPAVHLSYRDKRYIINMDQTPVFFSMHATHTVETKGSKTVHIRITKNGSQRVTVAVTLTAAGTQLPSLLIFKGKESDKGGKIIRRELSSYPPNAFYATQEKAWMSEPLMLLWIDKVLAPYVAGAPTGVVPLLFLDSYQVHKMASVNAAINNLGVEVVIIPPGCTGLTQPVDVGFNKPFKNNVRDHYEEWMMEAGRDLTVPPRRIDVARWIVAVEKDITSKILKNA